MADRDATPVRDDEWLIAALGMWVGTPDTGWRRHGPFPWVTSDIERPAGPGTTIYLACANGLWQADTDPSVRWIQLHDETLTEVTAVCATPQGLIAAGSYGVSRSQLDDVGQPRWTSDTETRSPDERFTNDLLCDDDRWLAATEGGVLAGSPRGDDWHATDLTGTAVRALVRVDGGYLAGTDTRGLWHSLDGEHWERQPGPDAVFAIAPTPAGLLLGSYDGIHVPTAGGYRRSGPRALVGCLATDGDLWLAGVDPGGLWVSTDGGERWQQSGDFGSVRQIRRAREVN